MTGADVVLEARRWVGTPFTHQGRVLGAGVDCAGLLIGVARALRLSSYDINGYNRSPDGYELRAECDREMDAVPAGQARVGDVLLLRMGRYPQHLAIVSAVEAGVPTVMIHAHADNRGLCVEHSIDMRWARRIVQVYRFKGVE